MKFGTTELKETRLAEKLRASDAFDALAHISDTAFWLDGGTAEPSYVGTGTPVPLTRPTLPSLRRAFARAREPARAMLGLIGWLSYDLGRETVGVDVGRAEGLDTSFMEVEEALEIEPDGTTRLLMRRTTPRDKIEERVRAWEDLLTSAEENPPAHLHDGAAGDVTWQDSDEEYAEKIRACQAHIRAGDAYQLCLTTRITLHARVDPARVYRRLRQTNGTSRSGIIRIGDVWLLSASPEQFLTVSDGTVSTSPIKGTRRRGENSAEDDRLRHELLHSVKERAENTMIVDLMRNDLNRICNPGTVNVSRFLEVDSHSQVHQLVSTIEGELRTGTDAFDAIVTCFPAGSMTGAPKMRAMQLLEEIECGPRGLYAGAFGFLRFDGAADFSMTIRTIVCSEENIVIGTGGGITALSMPAEEIDEIHLKARALLSAIETAAQPASAPDHRMPADESWCDEMKRATNG